MTGPGKWVRFRHLRLISTIDYTLKSPYTVTLASPQSAWYYLPPNDPAETWPLWFTEASYYQWGKPDLFATEYLGAFNNKLHDGGR